MKTSITDKAMIFRREYQKRDGSTFAKYSTSHGQKDMDGNWDNGFLFVKFRRGVSVPNRTQIFIKDGWLIFEKYEKEGQKQTSWGIFVNDFDIMDSTPENFTALQDEDIPF